MQLLFKEPRLFGRTVLVVTTDDVVGVINSVVEFALEFSVELWMAENDVSDWVVVAVEVTRERRAVPRWEVLPLEDDTAVEAD